MTIPESQLETWSHQGSVTQSSATYATVKRSLEAADTKYAGKDFEVFLQGSYGNDTNIYAESDVDVVIRLDSVYHYDVSTLTAEELATFKANLIPGTYPYDDYKAHVVAALVKSFGVADVQPGKRAVKIKANGNRRSADVVIATQFWSYYSGRWPLQYERGICFFTSSGDRIVNYPKQHSDNCTTKHQATANNFKPLVRIFKNMRSKLVADGLIGEGIAPSYFIEGLLYNVPNTKISGTTYGTKMFNVLTWLNQNTDRTKFVCANEQYYLLRDKDPVCWPVANGEQFINAVTRLWNNW
jgi:hypothetical protein